MNKQMTKLLKLLKLIFLKLIFIMCSVPFDF